jgi:hypothetical protein
LIPPNFWRITYYNTILDHSVREYGNIRIKSFGDIETKIFSINFPIFIYYRIYLTYIIKYKHLNCEQ